MGDEDLAAEFHRVAVLYDAIDLDGRGVEGGDPGRAEVEAALQR